MKVRMEITIGDKIIAQEYEVVDRLLMLHREPRKSIEDAQLVVTLMMAPAVDKALEELLRLRDVPTDTSNDLSPQSLRGDIG